MKVKGKRKTTTRKVTSSRKVKVMRGSAKNGALYAVAIIAVVATFGGVLAGGALPTVDKLRTPLPPGSSYTCCDSGDGAACHPFTDTAHTFTFNGQPYGLLKTNIVVNELQHYR